ncbi:MAG: glycosyltransferase [Anaerolineaceae bacterium]|jgi:glycosyltransferase involved in cell wall biosynthesis|nr:glycosyltransferase [Anaerolineaceae bacterium]
MNSTVGTPIRVLVVTNVYPTPDSPGTPSVQDQVEALRALDVEVNLLLIDKGRLSSFLHAAWQLFKLNFQPKRYDIVHTFFGHSAFLARCQFRYPIIATYLGSDLLGRGQVNWRDGFIGRASLLWVNQAIVMSEEMKTVTKREDTQVIPFGVNTTIFTPRPKQETRQECNLPLEENLILFPWNPVRPEKMFSLVEEAVEILQRTDPTIRVITIHGQPRECIAQYMNACDVLILTSLYEGSPVAVREAMACNLPIVSVDVGDVAEIIAGTDGCYIVERSAETIAGKLQQVFDAARRTNGIEKIKTFDAVWSANKVIQIYQNRLS